MVPNTTKIVLFAEKKHNFALSVYYILKYKAFCVETVLFSKANLLSLIGVYSFGVPNMYAAVEAYSFELSNMYAPTAEVHFTIENWTRTK